MIGVIYKITNLINGKVYIGVTKQNLYVRFRDHSRAQGKCRGHGVDRLISKAIEKYGKKEFLVEEIFCSKNYGYLLNEMEQYFIRLFRSHYIDGNGYNMTYGGEGSIGRVVSVDTRKKISDTRRSKVYCISSETRALFSLKAKGRKFSPTHVERLRSAALARGGENNPRAEIWLAIDPNGNNITIKGLQAFCKSIDIERNSLKYTIISGQPVRKGSSKGWQLISKVI